MNKKELDRLAVLQAQEQKGELTGEETAELQSLIALKDKDVEMEGGKKITRDFDCEVKSIDEEKYTLEAVASTASVDRYGDVVEQESWDLKKFKKNPVILANHFYTVQNVIGKAIKIKVQDGKLVMTVKFAVNESELAASVWKLIVGGYLNAWSVGFIPKEFEDNKDDKTGKYIRTLKNCELLEVSAVAVPANADCLTNAFKAGAINESEAKEVRSALGEDFQQRELDFLQKNAADLADKNKEMLKRYRSAFKKLNGVLGMTPTGDEQKDLVDLMDMAGFCLGLDGDDKSPEDLQVTKNLKREKEIEPEANQPEAMARTATQADLDRIALGIKV